VRKAKYDFDRFDSGRPGPLQLYFRPARSRCCNTGWHTVIGPDTAAAFARDGDTVQLTACGVDDDGAQFLYCAGTPNREPMVTSGPFMMSTKERLEQAKVDYHNGKMGRLEPSF
jgi:redox-sensitive bicupin YhaK (pirin superfamily)